MNSDIKVRFQKAIDLHDEKVKSENELKTKQSNEKAERIEPIKSQINELWNELGKPNWFTFEGKDDAEKVDFTLEISPNRIINEVSVRCASSSSFRVTVSQLCHVNSSYQGVPFYDLIDREYNSAEETVDFLFERVAEAMRKWASDGA